MNTTALPRLALAAALLAAATAPAAAKVAFPRADQNGDGVVTFQEAVRVMPRLKQIQFEKCDPDGDGLIDRGEYPLLDSFYGYVVDR
jgi:Ca2+-binding EF-hand superfamily protein